MAKEIVEYETLTFKSKKNFETWLKKNHSSCSGIWLKVFKKDSGIPSIYYAEALDVALCYGWIDGMKKKLGRKRVASKIYSATQRFGLVET